MNAMSAAMKKMKKTMNRDGAQPCVTREALSAAHERIKNNKAHERIKNKAVSLHSSRGQGSARRVGAQ